MSNTNTVNVTLSARDEISSVVRSVASSIRGDLSSSFTGAALKANLMTEAVKAGLGAIQNLVGTLSDGLKQAIDIQSENIATAGNIMKLTGQNYAQATEFIDEFSVKMSNVAAALPGATSDYVALGKALMDDVVPAFKNLDGSVNLTGLKKEMEEVATLGTLLAQSANVNTTGASNAISKFLGGTAGKGELMQLDFFQKNTTFRNTLFEEVEKLGKDVKELTVKQRLEIFKKAASVPKEVLDAQSKSIKGLMAGFQSSLFDPQSGIFGFMRDLDSKSKGNQSVLTSLNEAIDALIGEKGLFGNLSQTLRIMGVNFGDPMASLRSGIMFFTDKIKQVNIILDVFKRSRDIGGLEQRIRNFLATLLNFDLTPLTNSFGKGLANVVNNAVAFLLKIDYGFMAAKGMEILKSFISGIGTFLANLDAGVYATAAAGILIAVGVLPAITAFAGLLVTSFVAATAGLPLVLIAAATLAVGALAKAIIDNWGQITDIVGDFFKGVADGIWASIRTVKNVIDTGFGFIVDLTTKLVDTIKNLITGIQNKFNELLSKIPGLGGVQTAQPSGIGDAVSSMTPNAAGGWNTSSVMDALTRESRLAPSGSTPVVANSSELILNRSQTDKLIGSLSNKGGVSIGNINLYSSATDPKQAAKEFTDELMRQLNTFQQGYVAAPV